MDSTTPDPQHQQQQHQPQPQPQPMQQQQPPRPQQQPHQPKPQQQHQPPPQHQHQHQMHPQAGPYPPMQPYQSYHYRHPAPYPPQFGYGQPQYVTNYPPHVSPYLPQPWAQPPASFSSAPGQPLTNMVSQQPQTSVPQSHTKPSPQIINPVINPADQSHQLNLQSVTITNPALASTRQTRAKRVATLKNPDTNEIIPLEDTSTSQTTTTTTPTSTTIIKTSSTSSSSSSTTTTPANAVSASSTLAAPTTATTTPTTITTTTPATQTTNKEEKKRVDEKKQEESSPTKIVQTKQQNPAQTLLQHVSEDGLETKNPISKNGQDTKKVEAATNVTSDTASKDKKVCPSSSSTSEVGNASIPEDKIREKVNGNDEKGDSCKNVVKETDTKIESPKKVSDVKLDKPVPPASSNNGQVSESKKETDTTINETTQDGGQSSTEVEAKQKVEDEAGDQNECKVNGKDGEGQGDDSNKEDQESDSKAELHYEPWQYNPVTNRTGKKIYSKQFMLDVCEKVCKLDLSNKESDDKIGLENDGLQNAFSERFDMFAPAFSSSQRYTPTNRQNESARRQSQHVYAGRSSAGQERQRKVITSVSLTQEVELKTVSNPWKRAKDVKEDGTNDEVETESLKKKFRSILNKLTPNNFENLAKQVTDLCIDSESKLGEVIDIVFAKALAEPGYCVLYGQMCSHLKKITAGAAIFGNTLLKRCQHQFQSDIYSGLNLNDRREKIENEQDPEVKKQLNEELYEEMYRCRMRGLGLIKFIGELYKIEMLNDKIMFDCVLRLLSDTSEESLECLCDLLATIGEKLDMSSQKNLDKEKKASQKSAPKAVAYQGGQKSAAAVVASGSANSQQQKQAAANLQQEQQYAVPTTLDQVFEQLHKIRKNKDLKLSVRIRFKLLDTCELREKFNWQSKKTKDNNPKKIEEIREAHMEKLEQERRQQNAMGPRRSQEGRRGLGHSGGSSNQISSMGNESSGNRGQSNMHTSSSSHLLRDHSLNDMNMKTNHNDIESHKEHQKKIENFKTLSIFKDMANKPSSSSVTEPLRPSSQLRLGRPTAWAANSSSSHASAASASSSASAAPASAAPSTGASTATTLSSAAASKPTTTITAARPAGVTEAKQEEDPQRQES